MTHLSQRIAVFGDHAMALEVAGHLQHREYAVLIVDNNENTLRKARERGYETAQIDYTDDTELWTILSDKAINTLLCLFDNDAENVFLIISARALNPELRIVTIAESADSFAKLMAAGANKIINPHEIGGRKIWEFIKRPLIAEILDHTLFSQADLNMAELAVGAGSGAQGRRLRELLASAQYNVIVLGLVRSGTGQGFTFSVRLLDHALAAGDMLVVIGPARDIDTLRRDLEAPPSPPPS